jgi:hypothetical protein
MSQVALRLLKAHPGLTVKVDAARYKTLNGMRATATIPVTSSLPSSAPATKKKKIKRAKLAEAGSELRKIQEDMVANLMAGSFVM